MYYKDDLIKALEGFDFKFVVTGNAALVLHGLQESVLEPTIQITYKKGHHDRSVNVDALPGIRVLYSESSDFPKFEKLNDTLKVETVDSVLTNAKKYHHIPADADVLEQVLARNLILD